MSKRSFIFVDSLSHCSQPLIMPAAKRSARTCMTFFSSSVSHSGRIYLASRSSMTSKATATSRTLCFLSQRSSSRFGYRVKSKLSSLVLFMLVYSFLCCGDSDRHVILIGNVFFKSSLYQYVCPFLRVRVISIDDLIFIQRLVKTISTEENRSPWR